MENVNKILDFLRIPNPFRDVITLITGFASILFFQIILHINLLGLFLPEQFGRIESDLVILIISFVWGRLLYLLSLLIFDIIELLSKIFEGVFLDNRPLTIKWESFKQYWGYPNLRIKIAKLFRSRNLEFSVSPREVENEINIVELFEVIGKHPNIASETERYVYQNMFLQIIFSTTLIASIIISYWYFLSSIIIFYLINKSDKEDNFREQQIFRSIVKNQYNKK